MLQQVGRRIHKAGARACGHPCGDGGQVDGVKPPGAVVLAQMLHPPGLHEQPARRSSVGLSMLQTRLGQPSRKVHSVRKGEQCQRRGAGAGQAGRIMRQSTADGSRAGSNQQSRPCVHVYWQSHVLAIPCARYLSLPDSPQSHTSFTLETNSKPLQHMASYTGRVDDAID